MNKEIFTIENVVNALEADLDINHKANLVRYSEPVFDITGVISFSCDDEKVLHIELFENFNYSLSVYIPLKTDIEGNLICPVNIKNKYYIKKLNTLNKFYSLYSLLNILYDNLTLSLNIKLNFNDDIQIIADKTCISLSVSNGRDVILNIEDYMREVLETYGIEDQLDTNSLEEIFSLIEMVRI